MKNEELEITRFETLLVDEIEYTTGFTEKYRTRKYTIG